LDGTDLFFGASSGARSGETPAPFAPASNEEADAIIAIVPPACRASARWAVPLLLDTARAGGMTHVRRIAYLLATAQHASGFGTYLEERGTGPVVEGVDRCFDRYEAESPLGAALGNTEPGDGARFRGRGFVHIRGRTSYAIWSQRLGMPDQLIGGAPVPFFVAHPAALARPTVAAQTLVRGMRDGLFTGTPLGYFVNDKRTDYHGARRVVEGREHARVVADIALKFATAIEGLQTERHRLQMQRLAHLRAVNASARDLVREVREAVERLAACGEIMPAPVAVIEWNGEARQGKFVQLDDATCALHMGRGTYVRLDIQRDLNGIVPPEGRNMALKRSGDVRPAARHGEANFWR
jgi:putative chitinase